MISYERRLPFASSWRGPDPVEGLAAYDRPGLLSPCPKLVFSTLPFMNFGLMSANPFCSCPA